MYLIQVKQVRVKHELKHLRSKFVKSVNCPTLTLTAEHKQQKYFIFTVADNNVTITDYRLRHKSHKTVCVTGRQIKIRIQRCNSVFSTSNNLAKLFSSILNYPTSG